MTRIRLLATSDVHGTIYPHFYGDNSPRAWGLACLIAFVIWKMAVKDMAAYTLTGFLSAFETLVIIFGAILIMNTLQRSGAMSAITLGTASLSSGKSNFPNTRRGRRVRTLEPVIQKIR
jgi:hypothetical protein